MAERRNWVLLAGILLIACIYGTELAYVFSLTPDPCEDAYITFRFSKNLADGNGPVFNPGEIVEGYSNPLWMFSIAMARKLGLDMVSYSRTAGALFNTLALLLVWYIPWRWFTIRGPASLAGPVLYLLCLPLQFYAASGLETSLYTFLVIASAAAILWAGASAGRCTAAFFVLLLTALTRPEGVIFCAFYCLWLGWRYLYKKESLKPFLPGIILFALLYGAFLLWRLSYYGMPLPNTYYAKGSFPLYMRFMIGFFINRGFFTNYTWFLFLLPFFFFVKITDTRRALPPLYLFIAAGFVFSLGFSGWDWMPYFRYNLPVVPLMIVCCQLLFAELWRSWAPTRGKKLLWAFLAACILFAAGEQYWKDLSFNYRWRDMGDFARFNQRTMGEWIRRELGTKPVIAIGDVGYFAYISQATIIDLYGLTNHDFAELKTRYGSPDISFLPPSVSFATFKKKELELLLKQAPDYVFLYTMRLKISDTYPGSAPGIADAPAFNEKYEYMTSFSVIPDFTSDAWPKSIHTIDVADLSTGMVAWMRTGWGYTVYIRKDSPYPRFYIELGPDEKIKNILAVKKP
jgi:arabinofuranosyltransferase